MGDDHFFFITVGFAIILAMTTVLLFAQLFVTIFYFHKRERRGKK